MQFVKHQPHNDKEVVSLNEKFPCKVKEMDWLGKIKETGKSGDFIIDNSHLYCAHGKILYSIKWFVNVHLFWFFLI